MTSDETRGFALIGSGAVLLGMASILVRMAFPISALEVAFGRLAVAAVFVAAIAFVRSELRGWVGDARPYSLFGAVMALHFITFVGALALTSIAHALSIVYLAPAIIAIASIRVLGERLRPVQIAGIGLSIIGIAVLTGFERTLTARMLAGDGLAFVSAIFFAAYSIIGRIRRASMSVFAYTSRVYVWAAIWALPFALYGALSDFDRSDYTWGRAGAIALSGILPIGIGHTLYNASMRYISATKTNLVATQEITGGVILAAIVLAEIPSVASITGGAINLLGIFLVILGGRRLIRRRKRARAASGGLPG